MTKIFVLKIFLLTIILCSCNKKPKINKSPLDYLDITFNNKDGMTSIYIDSSKVIRVRIINEQWDKFYYQDTLTDSTFQSLDKLISTSLTHTKDSLINHQTCFTSVYFMNLSFNKNLKSIIVYYEPTFTYKPLDSLTKMLYKLSRSINKPTSDSLFVWKTFSRISSPPPPSVELTKFVPPEIK